jgi:hypothetical protein
MTFTWQDIAAGVVISTATIYIVMRLFRIGPWKRKTFCDICDTGVVEQSEKKLVHIELPKK